VIVAGILSPLENALRWLLVHLHDSVGLSWGWSIIGLTIIVRICLVPLMVRQIHSMQAMQAHMPEMKAIQQRYKGDRQRLNEELMKFYKENNINPAASCLPLVFQLPVFLSLYFVLKNFSKHVNAAASELGWLHLVPDITAKITAHWSGYLLLLVYVASQVASGYFASVSAQRSQRILMMVLPVFFVPVITRFPVGLLMYWVTTNLWTVGQGIVTRRMTPKPAAPVKRSSRTPSKEVPATSGDGDGAAAAPAEAKPVQAAPGPPRRVKRKKRRGRR